MIQRLKPWVTPTGLVVVLVVAIAFPFIDTDSTTTGIAVVALIFAAFAVSWNIFAGYTGYIALGHTAYFGIGAYALAIICEHNTSLNGWQPLELVPVCGLIAGVAAIPLGAIALRTRRHTFIVITIATFFVIQLLAENLRGITNGTTGINLPTPFQWFGSQLGLPLGDFYNIPFYYSALALTVLALIVSWFVRNSKYGLGLLAIRDDEDRALGLGVKTGILKLSAFVLSAIFVGMAGAIYVYYESFAIPRYAFDPLNDIAVALMAFMGGIGTLSGPLLGALVIESAKLYFGANFAQLNGGLYLIVYGALFLVVILLLPQGIIPSLRALWSNWRATGHIGPLALPAMFKTRPSVIPPPLPVTHKEAKT
jgi:ABC-type branched-subunit amino acid transport system permease subunit